MKKQLIAVTVVALAVPLATAATATAEKPDKVGKVEICHFTGHAADANQPDFILDLDLPYAERVEECTDLGGRVLSVNGNAVSYDNDDIRRGHEVDTPEQD